MLKRIEKYKQLLPPIFIVFLVLFYLRNILFPDAGRIVFGGDVLTQFYFWKGYLVESLKSGTIPFWNPYVFSGTPFLAHPATAFFYPATLIYLLLPLNISFSIVYVLHLIIAGWGTYALVRKYTDRLSAFLAASLCVFSGYFAARIYLGHVDILTTSVWIPWVILSFKELTEGATYKRLIRTVFFFSLMILAGYMAYVVFLGEFLVFFLIFNLVKAKFRRNPKSFLIIIRPVIIALIFGIGITAIQWLPTWQLTRESVRGQGLPYSIASWGSLPLSFWKLLFNPFDGIELSKISYGLLGGNAPNAFDHYPGLLPVLIVVIFGLVSLLGNKKGIKPGKVPSLPADFWLYFIFILYSVLISFGNNLTPNLHAVVYNFTPFYKFFRIPIQHLVFPVFLIPVMAGMVLGRFKNNSVKLVLGILCLLQLYSYGNRYLYLSKIPESGYDKNLTGILSKQQELGRMLPDFRVVSPVLAALDFNAAIKYKIPSTAGYDPVILKNYYYLIDVLNGNKKSSIYSYNVEVPPLLFSPGTFNYFNIRYILSEKQGDNELQKGYRKIINNPQYDLYENENVMPRFYLVNGILEWSGNSYPDIMESVLQRKEVLISKKDIKFIKDINPCPDNSSGYVQVISYQPNSIKLNVSTKCRTLLTGIENYYPGWKAKVDNMNTNIILSNITQRTIIVPKGLHTVEFYYQPEIYYISIIISILSLILLIILKHGYCLRKNLSSRTRSLYQLVFFDGFRLGGRNDNVTENT